ncbi:hypothetical protein BGX38DRAFT_1202791 [Terfezia claveryi]|nr:hypothetical protein BGX38DRAFT_1202791 [Terfezia claveryi]
MVKKLEAQVAGWEKDHSALKHLYKETDILSQTAQKKSTSLEIENTELKKHIQDLRNRSTEFRRGTGSMQADDDILDTLEDVEHQKLKRRVKELETLLEESKEPKKGHRRMMSEKAGFQEVQFLGNFSSIEDDEDFLPSTDDEERAGQEAQEAEWKRREERLLELKKGLEKWRGYRLDLTMVPGRAGWSLRWRCMVRVLVGPFLLCDIYCLA